MKTSKGIKWVIVVVVVVLISGTFLGVFGFRIGGLNIVAPGEITLLVPRQGSSIFVDNRRKTTTGEEGETVHIRSLPSGNHTVLVAKNGFLPWIENVFVESGKNFELRPFLVPSSLTDISIISKDTPEYQKAHADIESLKLPTEEIPRLSLDEKVVLWIEGTTVYAEWRGENPIPSYLCMEKCTPIAVTTLEKPIREIDFYPHRNDVILIASGGNIYALEVNPSQIQNFQPLYSGQAPRFTTKDSSQLYILDGDTLAEISL